ncbi:MAG TPA: zinc ribbon domain-containing protein [Gemmatimonadaceae bacterium]|nr:zinc ribbon domain-containing protein [Gemmatimonadaceae bacterium]
MTSSPASPSTCPACAARVDGRFCAQCGTPVDGATCAGCRAALTPGASFCHRCGTPAGAQPARAAAPASAQASALPWAFAAIVLLAFGAYVAAQHFAGSRAPAVAAATALPPGSAPFAGGAGGAPAGPAPDISNMSPEERADRLFDRIMTAYENGDSEYVQNMAPMALAAYEMLPTLDPLRRFDWGRIAEITGSLQVAQAHADTLLQANPRHLLGLILAARVADLEKDEARRAAFANRLIEAAPAELEEGRPEYTVHANTINIALTEARRRAR